MKKQLIISISREYGSRGHQIGEIIAKKLGVELYDRNLLEEVADDKGVNFSNLKAYDEKPKIKLFSRTVRGYSNNNAENIANLQFEHLKAKAREGNSFVVIGRCSDEIFNGICDTVKIFISAAYDDKVKRIMEHRNFSEKEAKKAITRHNASRASYHDYFCKSKWGDAAAYDLSVNMSRLGIEASADFIVNYITNFVDK